MEPQSLKELLKTYLFFFPGEEQKTKRFLQFLDSHPNGFERTSLVGHVTGSAWLLHPHKDSVLLTHHKKLTKWLQLGGHADGDTDVLSVALREAQEESGIQELGILSTEIFDIDIHLIPAYPGEPAHDHYDVCFAFRAVEPIFQQSAESTELAWVPIEQITRYSDEISMRRMQQKWLTGHWNRGKTLHKISSGIGS